MNLEEILGKSALIIPDYQRGYSWRRQQWDEFIDDLDRSPANERQYMGVLTLQKVSEATVHVVDGQQRLTTILVFCAEIRARLVNNFPPLDVDLTNRLKNLLWTCQQENEPRLRYQSQTEENQTLSSILSAENEPNQSLGSIYSRNLWGVSGYFKNYLAQAKPDKVIAYARQMLKTLYFEVLNIDEWQSFVVFECLNNRGKRLSLMELLKNRLLYLSTLLAADRAMDARRNIREKVNDVWRHIYQTLGTIEVEDDEPDTVFLRDHWIMRWGRKRSGKDAFRGHLLNELFHARRITENRRDWTYLDTDIRDENRFLSDLRNPPKMDRCIVQKLWENHFTATRALEAEDPLAEALREALIKDLNRLVNVGNPDEVGCQDQERGSKVVRAALDRIFSKYLTAAATTQLGQSEITEYCDSLKLAIDGWACLFRPDHVQRLFEQRVAGERRPQVTKLKTWLRRLQDLEFPAGRPLILALLLRLRGNSEENNFESVLRVLERLERLAFIDALAGCSNVRDKVQELARDFWDNTVQPGAIDDACVEVRERLDDIAGSSRRIYDGFSARVNKKNTTGSKTGFYGMTRMIRYFLFEYEYFLVEKSLNRGDLGIVEVQVERGQSDQSIEHVFPQSPRVGEWQEFLGEAIGAEVLQVLRHSLGNLVYVTGSFNTRVSNNAFDIKRPEYERRPAPAVETYGTLGTEEIAKTHLEWTPESILKRGVKLLGFLEQRWQVILGSHQDKERLLRLDGLVARLQVEALPLPDGLMDRPLVNLNTLRGRQNKLRSNQPLQHYGTLENLFNAHLNDPFGVYNTVMKYDLAGDLAGLQYEDLILAVLRNDHKTLEAMLPNTWDGAINAYFMGLDDVEGRALQLSFRDNMEPKRVSESINDRGITVSMVKQYKRSAKVQVALINGQFNNIWTEVNNALDNGDFSPLDDIHNDWRAVVRRILEDIV